VGGDDSADALVRAMRQQGRAGRRLHTSLLLTMVWADCASAQQGAGVIDPGVAEQHTGARQIETEKYWPGNPSRSSRGLMRMLDKNGDGDINESEFMKPVLRSVGGHDWNGDVLGAAAVIEWWEKLFAKADLNKDGTLNAAEAGFMGSLAKEAVLATADPEKRDLERDEVGAPSTLDLFDEVDLDGDGLIEKVEYAKAMEKSVRSWGWGAVDAEIRRWQKAVFTQADQSGDGFLNPDEFHFSTIIVRKDLSSGMWSHKRFVSAIFQGLDKDKNKVISKGELDEAIRKEKTSEVPLDSAGTRSSVFSILRENFDSADKNKDGVLDESEILALSKDIIRLVEGAGA